MIDPVPGLQISVLLFLLCLSTDQVVFLLQRTPEFGQFMRQPVDLAEVFYPEHAPTGDLAPMQSMILIEVDFMRHGALPLLRSTGNEVRRLIADP